MILDTGVPFPTDIRVEKEIAALTSADHEVTVLTARIPASAPVAEDLRWAGARVVRSDSAQTPRSVFKRVLDRLRMFESTWEAPVRDFIRKHKPDVLHVHDLLMVPTALAVARPSGLPVVADLHENMPAAWRAYRAGWPLSIRLRSSILENYHVFRWHEARALKQCVKVIVVVPEAKQRLFDYGLTEDRIVVVSNTEDATTFPARPDAADPEVLKRYRGHWIAGYIGGLGAHRGLDTTLRAVPRLREAIPNFRLLVVGLRDADRSELDSQVKRMGLGGSVEVLGWAPFSAVAGYIAASTVCLVPHNNFEHTNTTVPHKLFQYMISGKPVLVSSCPPLKRIVQDTGAGLVFEAGDSESLARRMIEMYEHPERMKTMGECGRRAALGPYAWSHDARRLTDMYAELGATRI